MSGELAKVIIRGYELPDENAQQGAEVATFHAMFNPESFGVSNNFSYDESQADSDTGSELKFQKIEPREFSFDFVIDSTGAGGNRQDVTEQIETFKNATGFREVAGFVGQQRRTFFLTITWGGFNIRCVLKSMEAQYTLFRPDGTPIRATISATFSEYKTPQQQARENPESVLNQTQVRNVLDRDNLTNMAKNLYGDSKKYIDVAKANGINNLKELVSGSRLNFPPVDQLASALPEGLSPFVDQGQQLVQGALDLAAGKGQAVQSISDLANSALAQVQGITGQLQGQAQGLLQQGQNIAGQLQGQAQGILQQGQGLVGQLQGQAQGLLQQGQNIAGQLQGQAQGILQQGENLVGGLQGQIQGQVQSLLQQGQNIGGQLQGQAGNLLQSATQFAQGAGSGLLQNAEELSQGIGGNLLQEAEDIIQGTGGNLLQSGREALSEGFDDITKFFDF